MVRLLPARKSDGCIGYELYYYFNSVRRRLFCLLLCYVIF